MAESLFPIVVKGPFSWNIFPSINCTIWLPLILGGLLIETVVFGVDEGWVKGLTTETIGEEFLIITFLLETTLEDSIVSRIGCLARDVLTEEFAKFTLFPWMVTIFFGFCFVVKIAFPFILQDEVLLRVTIFCLIVFPFIVVIPCVVGFAFEATFRIIIFFIFCKKTKIN